MTLEIENIYTKGIKRLINNEILNILYFADLRLMCVDYIKVSNLTSPKNRC